MTKPRPQTHVCQNRLIAKLSESLYLSLLPLLDKVENKVGEEIYRQGQPIKYVYFPCNGTFSTLIAMADDSVVEVGTIGNESFTGRELLFGAKDAHETMVCQIEGTSLRLHAEDFMRLVDAQPALHQILLKSVQGYFAQVVQNAVCDRFHSVDMRFARWLLISHDRVQADTFNLTHESIAAMMGAHRPTLSMVAGTFQQAGILRYARGIMQILDRARLEEASCECYAIVRSQYETMFGASQGKGA